MENAITHTLFLATVLILFSFARSRKITWPLAAVVFLATISRIDSVYHIAPLLLLFSLFWWFAFRNWGGLYFSLAVFGLWLAFHLGRYLYFGDLLPNSAYAQGISATAPALDELLQPAPPVLEASRRIFAEHGVYLLLAAAPFLFFVRREKAALLLFLLIGSLALTSWFSPAVLGPARLDVTRTTTQLAVFTAVGAGAIFYYIDHWRLPGVGPVLLAAGLFVFQLNAVEPRYLCCNIQRFEAIREEFTWLAEQEALPRPTVANPDLGAMSWHKQFNIVDLGKLGSPIMAKLSGRIIPPPPPPPPEICW